MTIVFCYHQVHQVITEEHLENLSGVLGDRGPTGEVKLQQLLSVLVHCAGGGGKLGVELQGDVPGVEGQEGGKSMPLTQVVKYSIIIHMYPSGGSDFFRGGDHGWGGGGVPMGPPPPPPRELPSLDARPRASM